MDFDRLTLANLSRHFERRHALSQVSLECGAGDIVGLLGHNGAGKSTLLAIVATLLRPSSGEVRYGNTTGDEATPALRARIGFLAHELQLYPELSAGENLRFFGRLYGVKDVEAAVASGLERAGLAERSNEAVSSFSRGMRQRLALERTLLHDPRLVLLDEPFTGLDAQATRAVVQRLHHLAHHGRIVVLATHDLDLAAEVVTRAAILRRGRLAGVHEDRGSLRERYAHEQARGA